MPAAFIPVGLVYPAAVRSASIPFSLPASDQVSRDSHVTMSRDVTLENRQDKNRVEKITTEQVRLLLSEIPMSKISDQVLQSLTKRHGLERLRQVADVVAETWRRSREEMHNHGVIALPVVRISSIPCDTPGERGESPLFSQEGAGRMRGEWGRMSHKNKSNSPPFASHSPTVFC